MCVNHRQTKYTALGSWLVLKVGNHVATAVPLVTLTSHPCSTASMSGQPG